MPAADLDEEANEDDSASRSLYIKGLSFTTDEKKLKAAFDKAGEVRAVFIPQKSGTTKSAGYGFIEFARAASADVALRDFQGLVLDGRTLEVRRSQKELSKGAAPRTTAKASQKSRILVKNVAFQASAAELRELFSHFGAIKNLRMPKKFDGTHRGFAFVTFVNAHEALEAMHRLGSTHLYGRHLVLEWVDDDATDDVAVARAAAVKSISLGKVGERARRAKEDLEEMLEDEEEES